MWCTSNVLYRGVHLYSLGTIDYSADIVLADKTIMETRGILPYYSLEYLIMYKIGSFNAYSGSIRYDNIWGLDDPVIEIHGNFSVQLSNSPDEVIS